jgi:Zn-dependent protease
MNLLSGSLRVGRLFGIEIRVHMLFIILSAYWLITSKAPQSTAMMLTMLYLIVLMHEFGHCFAARAVGGEAHTILMWPLGGLAYAHAPLRPWPQFVTVAGGPLVNVVFCMLSGAGLWHFYAAEWPPAIGWAWLNPLDGVPLYRDTPWLVFAASLFYNVNLLLLAFNLLPIYPLDGGQLFQAVVWHFVGLQRATRIACMVGIGGAIVIGGLGMLEGRNGARPPMLLFIALWGGYTCWQRLRMLNEGMLIEDDRFDYAYMNVGRRENWFARLRNWFRRRTRGRRRTVVDENPNPGGWQRKQAEYEQLDQEVDRILKKVREHGLASLSYVEQQTLKRATELRQEEEQRHGRID